MLAWDEFRLDHPALRSDRYAYYERCRAASPIQARQVPLGDGRSLQQLFLLSYGAARDMLTHEAARRRPSGAGEPDDDAAAFVLSWLVFRDPPRHEKLRALMQPAFSPQRLQALEERICHRIEHILSDLSGPVDVVAEIAVPLPLLVLCDLIGLPEGDWQQLRGWSERLSPLVLGQPAPPDALGEDMLLFFSDALTRNRGAETLMGSLATAAAEGALSHKETIANMVFLVWAGHETTARLIGSLIRLLISQPAALARLRQDPARVPAAVDEALRLESPVQMATRWATADIPVEGCVVPAGSMVTAVLGAANRDPDRFADPAVYDLDRKSQHLASFGFGPHYCLGDRLARLECRLLLERLLRRFPSWHAADREPDWDDSVALRGLKNLTVDFSRVV